MKEQELIRRYFSFPGRRDVVVGVGDDAAIVQPPPETPLAISTDTLVEGVHFLPDTPPDALARKAAAVSLSDIAAMGATPLWMTVALSAPPAGEAWFADFAAALAAIAAEYDVAVIGGDLTKAEKISVTTTLVGAQAAPPMRRDAAQAGDDIWLSGATGEAAFALGALTAQWTTGKADNNLTAAMQRLHTPTPRVHLGQALAYRAHAAMDLSDGLITAARTMAAMSGVRFHIRLERLPVAACFDGAPDAARWQCMLSGGDDYELLFTAPAAARDDILALQTPAVPLTQIGAVVAGDGVQTTLNGQPFTPQDGYEHDFGG